MGDLDPKGCRGRGKASRRVRRNVAIVLVCDGGEAEPQFWTRQSDVQVPRA